MRLGLFGGTFDPIHLGHLIIAESTREALGLDRLDFVPAGDPWQKASRAVTVARVRVAMVRAAIEGNPGFGVELREVEREGPSYSADTVEAVRRALLPDDELYYLVGADAAAGIRMWHEPERLLANCTLVIAERPGAPAPSLGPYRPEEAPILLNTPLLEISSSDIRARVRLGRSIRYLVPEAVIEIIRNESLYREATPQPE